jgi:hypothetical protein
MMSDEYVVAAAHGDISGVAVWRAAATYERREAPWTHV